MRVDCLGAVLAEGTIAGLQPGLRRCLRLEGSAARNGARVVNPDEKDQVRVGYISLVMERRLRRCSCRHSIVVAPAAVPAQNERSRKSLIQKCGIVLTGGAQLDEIDCATDRARARQRILADKVLLKSQVRR